MISLPGFTRYNEIYSNVSLIKLQRKSFNISFFLWMTPGISRCLTRNLSSIYPESLVV